MTAAGGLTFTTTVRVVDRVHRNAAVGGLDATPAVRAGLADGHVLVVRVANLADRRHALDQHAAGLAGRQLQQRVIAFLRDQLHLRAGRTGHLRALAGTQLDVVHDRAGRNVLQRQRVADQNVGLRAAHDLLADLQPERLNDVALFAVRIMNQRDARAAVRVVLDGRDGAGNAVLVALEVDEAQLLLVAAALVADTTSLPMLLRPPVRGLTESSALCGLLVVMSSLTSFVWKRSVGVIGRNDLIGMVLVSFAARFGFVSARYVMRDAKLVALRR